MVYTMFQSRCSRVSSVRLCYLWKTSCYIRFLLVNELRYCTMYIVYNVQWAPLLYNWCYMNKMCHNTGFGDIISIDWYILQWCYWLKCKFRSNNYNIRISVMIIFAFQSACFETSISDTRPAPPPQLPPTNKVTSTVQIAYNIIILIMAQRTVRTLYERL